MPDSHRNHFSFSRILVVKFSKHERENNHTAIVKFGNELPEYDALDKWLDWDMEEDNHADCIARNDFGIYGLFFGEWCDNIYRDSYNKGSTPQENVYVIRGGGAYLWPWQDEEWVMCMSAMRAPSTDLDDDQRSAARAVILIND